MKEKWKKYCFEGGIRQTEKNLIKFVRLPEFQYEPKKKNFIYAQVDIYSSINRRKTQGFWMKEDCSMQDLGFEINCEVNAMTAVNESDDTKIPIQLMFLEKFFLISRPVGIPRNLNVIKFLESYDKSVFNIYLNAQKGSSFLK